MPISDRNEIRRQYAEAWAKARRGGELTVGERRIAEVIGDHPEYQRVIESGEAALEAEFPPEAGATNPFLHMGLHIAIREQVAIDRPPGARRVFQTLAARGDAHDAEHAMIECLAETLWEAQRAGRPPDDSAYAARLCELAGSDLG